MEMILILSNKYDICVDYVVRLLLENNIDFLRVNTEDLVDKRVSITLPKFSYRIEKKGIHHNLVHEVQSVWFRRPGKPFEFTPQESRPSESVAAFVENQWHAFIEGLKCIGNVFWINDPDKNHTSENKIYQLKLAQKIGLQIPKTCITNDKEEVMHFMRKCEGKIVAKALYSPLIEEPNKDFFIFTNVIDSIKDIKEQEFNLAPTIFQEFLTEKTDYRLTIIGDNCFSVKVIRESNRGISEDWRIIKEGVKFEPCSLPVSITDKCVKMVKKLGLVFAAIDLVRTFNEIYFLEINPNGEWAWLQSETELPIAETLVSHLVNRGGKR
jgi:glutathione synthase/RimK-type ligase-like ATP-grasp enzyme